MKTIRTKKTSLFIKVGIFAFAAYIVVSLVSLQMEIVSKRNELFAYEQQVEAERLETKELERQISLGEDKTHLARIARDKLDMGLSDEHVFRDAAGS